MWIALASGIGSENDVLDRYKCCKKFDGEIVFGSQACPLIDPFMVDECIKNFLKAGADYFGNVDPPTYPDGLDIEVITRCALALIESCNLSDIEHVTPYILNNIKYTKSNISIKQDLSDLRWTVDCQEDLDIIIKIF